MSDARRPEPCPDCSTVAAEQAIGLKAVGGFVNGDDSWTKGRRIVQLHPNHPDRMAHSKNEMERKYRKHGICLDTGKYVSKEAQIKATVPRKLRTGKKLDESTKVSGVRD